MEGLNMDRIRDKQSQSQSEICNAEQDLEAEDCIMSHED